MRAFRLVAFVLTAAAGFAQTQPVGPLPAPSLVREPRQQTALPPGDTITIPAGTKVPLILKQGISTGNARPGDPVYAMTNFPVIVGDRVVIPQGAFVQGVIDEVKRAGRVKGRAELLVHFRTVVLPSGYTVPLGGAIEGSHDTDDSKVKDPEGTIEHNGEKGKDAKTVGEAAGAGAGIGSLATHSIKGAAAGGGAGAAGGLIATLLMRGSDLKLQSGTTLDMVLERSVTIDSSKLK